MAQVTMRSAVSRAGTQQSAWERLRSRLGPLEVSIFALSVATAWIHLNKAMGMGVFGGRQPMMRPPMPSGGQGLPVGIHRMGPPLMLPLPLPVLFLLNFIGYAVLIVALFAPVPLLERYRRLIRWALIAFAAVTILGYFLIIGAMPNALGALDKAIEFALIGLLLVEDRWAVVSRAAAAIPAVARRAAR
jgi:hypothetical protein